MKPYTLHLYPSELAALSFLTGRGYFPREAWDALERIDGDGLDNPDAPGVWAIPEHAAWSISDLVSDDPDAYAACAAPELRRKLWQLWQSIV